ncbi:MAG: ferrochelatase [Paraglaciecola sp.]|jgi:ferrochelatase
MKHKTGVLLINLGTPDSPSTSDVRSYLFQFLNDPRVIDLPWLLRKILVNLIIVPFRAPKSAKLYQQLWTENGSPLLHNSNIVSQMLDDALGEDYTVHLAMRYKNPSIPNVLDQMKKLNYSRIVVLPMFPQYASASTGSALEMVMKQIGQWWAIPELKFISQYYDHPDLIDAIIDRASQYNLDDYDHVLFSYHGLPTRHVDKVYEDGLCTDRDCHNEITEENQYCYKASCFATTRLLAEKLGLTESDYTVCFQSRLDKNWLEPFSDKVVESWAKKGAKKLLVFSPAFTSDCLETVIEIGDEYQEIFVEHGGENVQLVESLNDHPLWVSCLKKLVQGT